jgi:hypothetical protein
MIEYNVVEPEIALKILAAVVGLKALMKYAPLSPPAEAWFQVQRCF